MQGQFVSDTQLNLAAHEVRNQNLVFERPDLEADLFIEHAVDNSSDFGNHGHLQAGSFCT